MSALRSLARPLVLRPLGVGLGVSSGRLARPLSTSVVRRHKESESEDPDYAIEKLKNESLEFQKKGKGEWMPGLASDSEEAIKADKAPSPMPQPPRTPEGKTERRPAA